MFTSTQNTPSLRKVFSFTALMALVCCVGCDALTDGDYNGEPRLVVNGQIQSLSDVPAGSDLSVIIGWANFFTDGDTVVLDQAEIASTGFPIDYSLPLYDEPPAGALNDAGLLENGEGEIGFGRVIVATGTDPEAPGFAISGLANDHVIVFSRGLNDDAMSRIAGIIENPEDMVEGYNLALGVCAAEGEVFDTLRIVDEANVQIEARGDDEDEGCLNFF